jgi:hypothetical protein
MDDDYYNSEYDYQDREMEGEGSVAGDGSVGAQGST